jgi:hypothetical protein
LPLHSSPSLNRAACRERNARTRRIGGGPLVVGAVGGGLDLDFAGTHAKIVPGKLIGKFFGDRTAMVDFAPGTTGVGACHVRRRDYGSRRTLTPGLAGRRG